MQAIEPIEKWRCLGCSNLFGDRYDAQNHCQPTEIYVCPICNDDFWEEREAKEHIETHKIDELTSEEIYLNELRFPTGKFTLNAEWAIKMELEKGEEWRTGK